MRIAALSLAAVVVSAAASGCFSIPTAAEAGVSYATEVSAWPAAVECLNRPGLRVAKEVLKGDIRTVVIAGGERPISDEEWGGYTPSFGNIKNSDRHLLFSASCFARSPGLPIDCRGDACRTIVELDGHTWVALSQIDAYDCVPADGGCSMSNVEPHHLAFIVTEKCHELRFTGEAVFLRGPDGEVAVMHATPDGNPRLTARLPDGWTVAREALSSELVVHPFGGGDRCFYNIIRDELQQSYHQIVYARPTYP